MNLFGEEEPNDDYERRKERSRRKQSDQARKGRDIGPLPPVADPARREACRLDLKRFCLTYHAPRFNLDFSADHLVLIERLQTTILEGGQQCFAFPRGSGKTALVIATAEWASGYGHRRYIVPIAATGDLAEALLETIKTDWETNELLAADFPEICHAIRKLEGINNRATGQILNGHRTRIKWTGRRLVYPTIVTAIDAEGRPTFAPSSGVIVQAAGLTGAIRGMQYTLANGETIRPDVVILDDPQTDESARRPAQTATRLNLINKGALGLAGPTTRMAAIMPCTVIQPGDLADQLLDRDTNPEWRGQKTKLLYSMPTNIALWHKYKELREESLKEFEDIRLATEFYRQNRAAMDEGAVPAWPARYLEGQLSAIQYAMDIWAKDEGVFLAEYQNSPKLEEEAGIEGLRAAELLTRCNGIPHRIVPNLATRLTAFVDVQQDALFWLVMAWADDFTGWVIDYGIYPDQPRKYITLRDLADGTGRTLRDHTKQSTVDAALQIGLEALADELLERTYKTQSATPTPIGWIGIDANWQEHKNLVYQVCRTRGAGRIIAHHGRFVGAAGLPMGNWRKEPGTRDGHFWRIVPGETRQRAVLTDVNAWKSIVMRRLRVGLADSGGITFYGDRPRTHELLCDHLSAEFAVCVTGRGRRVDEWKNRPGRDNHFWDGVIGCAVGASILGASIPGQATKAAPKRVSLRDQQEQQRKQRGA